MAGFGDTFASDLLRFTLRCKARMFSTVAAQFPALQ